MGARAISTHQIGVYARADRAARFLHMVKRWSFLTLYGKDANVYFPFLDISHGPLKHSSFKERSTYDARDLLKANT